MKSAIIKRLPVALILYLLLSLLFFGAVGDYSRMYFGYGIDPIQFIWFLNWWPWAIAHRLNPFISYYVWYPHGFNMTWATSMPIAALLMWPVTWLGTAVLSYNVLSLAAPVLSAWTAFLLARYLTRDVFASFIGGYLFGFSSYELGEIIAHLNLDMIFILPLIVLLVVQRVRDDLTRPWFVTALALAMFIQLGLSSELLATTCFFGAITWAIFLLFATNEERRRLWAVAREIILATAIMVAAAVPFLYFVMRNRGDVPPHLHDPEVYSHDALNYLLPCEVVPGHTLVWTRAFPALHSYRDNGGFDAYLGIPLILILILQLRELRRRPYLKPLLLSLLVIVILSLGPALHIAGVATGLWLPWRLILRLPFISQALPTRFSMFVALVAGLIAALWLAAAKSGRERVGRYTLAGLACVCLLPDPGFLRHWTRLPLEPFFEPQNIAASLEKNANVIILPYLGPGLIWQWQSGMHFTQSGGYVGFTPQSESLTWPVLGNLYTGRGGPLFKNDLSGFCSAHRVSAVLVGPGTSPALVSAISALHWQETNIYGVRVVRVPDSGSLHFYHIWGDYWPQDGWIGHRVNIVTHGQPVELRISGQSRPADLGPVEISATFNGSAVATYRIGNTDTEVLRVPGEASVTLTASAAFIPTGLPPGVEQRRLSVVLSVQPESALEQAR
jgi:hypothetical protein